MTRNRILRRLKIGEVSSVDNSANDGAKILLRKRDNTTTIDTAMSALAKSVASIVADGRIDRAVALGKTFCQFRDYLKANIDFSKANPLPDDEDEDDDIDNTDTDTELPGRMEEFIAALQAANPNLSREDAARYLIHGVRGRTAAAHMASTFKRKDESMPNRAEEMREMRDFAKQAGGMSSIAKHIVAKGTTTLTEHEFTSLLMEHARLNKGSGESDAAAFSRIFSVPESIDIRRAHAITKNTPTNVVDLKPVQPAAVTVSADDSAAAYAKLQDLAAAARAAAPQLSEAQAFAKAFTENPDLAAKAHRRPSATTSYAYPT